MSKARCTGLVTLSLLALGLLAPRAQAQVIQPVESVGASGVVRLGAYGDDDAAYYILSTTNFTFYGKTYQGLTVSTNGVVTFGNTGYFSTNPTGKSLPIGAYPGVWAAQDDWRQSSISTNPLGFLYYKSYPEGLAITWAYVLHSPSVNGGPTNSFQVFLYNDGDIGLGYDDLNKTQGYVVGINKGADGVFSSITGVNTGQTAFGDPLAFVYGPISRHQYRFRYDGANYVEGPVEAHTASGTITLPDDSHVTGTFTFQFRPKDGSPPLTKTLTLSGSGTFSLEDIPAQDDSVWIKGSKWLAKVVPMNFTGGDVGNVSLSLSPGDVNNDNRVDIADLGGLADAFNSTPSDGGWNPQADLNDDGRVDINDLGLLADNFNLQGDP